MTHKVLPAETALDHSDLLIRNFPMVPYVWFLVNSYSKF